MEHAHLLPSGGAFRAKSDGTDQRSFGTQTQIESIAHVNARGQTTPLLAEVALDPLVLVLFHGLVLGELREGSQ